MYKDFRNEKPEEKKTIMDDLSFSNMVALEAVVNILVKKGICPKEELIMETKRVKERWEMLNRKVQE